MALERADAPLLRRQRVAIKGALAIERRQLGEELREVRDKLEAALVNSRVTPACEARLACYPFI